MLSYEERSGVYGTAMPASHAVPAVETMSSHKQISEALQPDLHRHIWIITGPAGCGKSTVAQYISENLSIPYIEGDEYHPPANIKKMASGIPLTDADRWDWLVLLRQKAVEQLNSGSSGVVLTCSALKRKYRDVIRIASYNDHDVLVHFVYLHADEEVLLQRVRARTGHYMKDSMVHSQFMNLEVPSDEERDVLGVNVSMSLTEVENIALGKVRAVLADDA
ncbi:MAG: hypothetical protein M1827_006469 [Pycnora praestabilis]|nr:MAG: hypothetical protein M1827_006469 [Pycnora praestabilis]